MDNRENKDKFYDLILSEIPGGVAVYHVMKDGSVKLGYISEGLAKICGYTVEEFIEKFKNNTNAAVIPEDLPIVQKAIAGMNKSNKTISFMFRLMKKGGEIIHVRFNASVTFVEEDNSEELATLYAVQSLVLEKERLELENKNREYQIALEEAQKASKAKTDFLSTISHDMRTPLNGMLGMTHLMLERAEDERMRQDLIQMDNAGHYLLNLINDTLDVSKIESGEMKLNPTVCDGKSTINSIMSLVKPSLDEKEIELVLNIGALLFTQLYIDMGRLEQVVMNVMGNAIKFTPKGGQIEFTMENLSVENDVIKDKISIKDNGIGMSKEFLPHIFEPFQQENSGNTTNYKGTGLGMTITKKIVELMGGEISVESQIGQGTTVTFTICLPIATKEQIAKSKINRYTNEAAIQLAGKRILLCEDHPLNREIASRMLSNKGMIVETAENGKIGVDLFVNSKEGYFDAILMDIRMPEMDGFEATGKIRNSKHPQAMTIPIIAMTANAFDTDIQASFDVGMDAHLSKPFEPQKLFETLAEHLSTNRQKSKEELLSRTNLSMLRTVLVVDDIDVNAAVIAESLEGMFRIITATNGVEALDILEKEKDVIAVITDIQMPGMTGIEMLKRYKSQPYFENIPVVVITSSDKVEDQIEAFQAGANDFISKPFMPEIVITRVDNVMASSRRMLDIQKEKEALKLQSETDLMTGLFNKVTTETSIKNELSLYPRGIHALMMIDIDNFKSVNDNEGHLVGDKTIKIIANQIVSLFRSSDIMGRFGGDEFCVFMSNLPNMDIARKKAQELAVLLKYKPNLIIPANVSVSIGLAFSNRESLKYDELMKMADEALYDAKKAGKARVSEYGQSISEPETLAQDAVLLISRNRNVCSNVHAAMGISYAVVECGTAEGLEQIGEVVKKNAVLSFIDLSDEKDNGVAMLKEISEKYSWIKDHPFLCIYKEGELEQVKTALQSGTSDILQIPFDMKTVQRVMKKYLSEEDETEKVVVGGAKLD